MYLNNLLCFLLSFLLIWSPVAQALITSDRTSEFDVAQVRAELNRLFQAAEEARQKIDRTEFDLDAVLEEADFQARGLIAFVREKVAFEPYPGVLRGPVGALMSRSGNSVDQALLLAKLLKDAGYDARIARTTLTEDQASRLLAAGTAARPVGHPTDMTGMVTDLLKRAGLYDRLDESIKEVLRGDDGKGLDASEYPLSAEIVKAAATLKQGLEDADAFGVTDQSAALVEEARDYFWVQMTESAGGGWVDVHPCFDPPPGFEPRAKAFFADRIPTDIQHRFRFQVFVEQVVSGELVSKPVTSAWERPTANLNAVPLVFTNLTDDMLSNADLFYAPKSMLKQADWFVPAFNGAAAENARYFDTHGRLIDPMAIASPAAGIFKTVGDLFAEATGEISGGNVPTLTAQWIEFTLIAPDGAERKFRRTTMDRVGPAKRRKGRVETNLGPPTADDLAPLLQRQSFMIANGEIPRSLVVDLALEQLLRSRPLAEVLLDRASGNTPGTAELSRTLSDVPSFWGGHLTLFAHLDRADDLDRGRLLYRPAPTLVIHSEGLNAKGRSFSAVDIVQNPRRSLYMAATGPTLDRADVLQAGVWDTFVEGLLLPPSDQHASTRIVFDRAARSGAKLKVIKSVQDLTPLQVSEDTKASMKNDLEMGMVLVTPDHSPQAPAGWWRIDPRTGETIGQIGDARGSEITEYIEGLALGISIAFLAISLINCGNRYDPETMADEAGEQAALACCSILSVLWFGMGYYIGVLHWTVGAFWDSWFSVFDPTQICETLS